jgi:hypothetical protein
MEHLIYSFPAVTSSAVRYRLNLGVPPQFTSRSALPAPAIRAHSRVMGTKSRETVYGSSIRASAERAAEARKEADRLACEAWNQRMLGFQGPGPAFPNVGRRAQCGLSLSRSQMPWLRHPSDSRAEHRAPAEVDFVRERFWQQRGPEVVTFAERRASA